MDLWFVRLWNQCILYSSSQFDTAMQAWIGSLPFLLQLYYEQSTAKTKKFFFSYLILHNRGLKKGDKEGPQELHCSREQLLIFILGKEVAAIMFMQRNAVHGRIENRVYSIQECNILVTSANIVHLTCAFWNQCFEPRCSQRAGFSAFQVINQFAAFSAHSEIHSIFF